MKEKRQVTVSERELEVFDVFTRRALAMVRKNDDKVSIGDACKLVDAALKAMRNDTAPSTAGRCNDEADKRVEEEVRKAYAKLKKPKVGQGERKEAGHVSN